MNSFEFGTWCAALLLPVLHWVNGPAVSPDQFVVRCGLSVAAVALAIGLRVRALRAR